MYNKYCVITSNNLNIRHHSFTNNIGLKGNSFDPDPYCCTADIILSIHQFSDNIHNINITNINKKLTDISICYQFKYMI